MDRLFRSTDSSGYTTDGSSWYPRRFFQSSEDYASRKSDYVVLFVFILTVALLLAAFVRSFREKPINIASHPHEFAARPQLPSQLLATARTSTERIAPLRRSSRTRDAGPPQTATHPLFTETAIPDDSATTIDSFKHIDATTSYTTSTITEFEPTSKQTPGKKSYTRVCHGSGCAQIANELEALLDDNVDPCTDFYHHVCGKWLTNHTPPRGSALISARTLRLKTFEHVLLNEMKDGTDDGFLKWPLHLWQSCRLKTGERDSFANFQRLLHIHGLGGYPYRNNLTGDVSEAAARVLVHSAVPALANVEITKQSLGPGKSAQWAIRIGPPKTLFRNFVKMREVNTDWFHSAVERTHGLRDTTPLLKIEQALVDLAGSWMAVNNYVVRPVSALVNTHHWNWLRFLSTAFKGVMRIRKSTLVTVKGDPFQRALVALIERFGSGNILNYLGFRLYVRYSPFLNLLDYLELALLAGARLPGWEDGDPLEEATDLRCLRVLSKSLPEPYAYLFWNAELRNQRRVRDSTDALVEDVIAEAVRRVREDLNLTFVVTNRFRDGMFKLRRQVFVPEWFASGNSKANYTHRFFGKGEGQPCLMLMHGALDSATTNTFLRMVNGSFETFWRGSSLRDTPWLDFDNGYLAVPPAAVDKNFTKDAFFVRHVPTLGIDLAREAFSRLTDLDLVSKIGPPGYVAHLRLEMLASCLHKQSYGNRGPGEVASREDARDLLALPVALKVFKQNAAHGSHRFTFRDSRVGPYATERLFFYEFALGPLRVVRGLVLPPAPPPRRPVSGAVLRQRATAKLCAVRRGLWLSPRLDDGRQEHLHILSIREGCRNGAYTRSTPQGEEACLSSSPFSVHDESPGEESPDAGSASPAAISMAPSSRESRSCDTIPSSPVRQVISPPPRWRPSPWSPSHSAPDLRGSNPGPTRGVGASTASGPARAKSPFWFTSPESVQPRRQLTPGLGEAVELQSHPPGSGDGEDPATENHPTTDTISARSGSVTTWWLVPVVVLGACAGLLLLAVAALGTTYTYRSVIARIAAAERAASQQIGKDRDRAPVCPMEHYTCAVAS
ncbi:hypothetical protein MTO96_000582 [Rhipicephalus appendiculatus]